MVHNHEQRDKEQRIVYAVKRAFHDYFRNTVYDRDQRDAETSEVVNRVTTHINATLKDCRAYTDLKEYCKGQSDYDNDSFERLFQGVEDVEVGTTFLPNSQRMETTYIVTCLDVRLTGVYYSAY